MPPEACLPIYSRVRWSNSEALGVSFRIRRLEENSTAIAATIRSVSITQTKEHSNGENPEAR
jgi:hypothetical protein